MTDHHQTLEQIQEIVRNVLDDDSIVLSDATVAEQVPSWDSLAHVRIMVAIEKFFKIRFETDELNSFGDVGTLVDGVIRKLSA
jgi:acyl carrier protein